MVTRLTSPRMPYVIKVLNDDGVVYGTEAGWPFRSKVAANRALMKLQRQFPYGKFKVVQLLPTIASR